MTKLKYTAIVFLMIAFAAGCAGRGYTVPVRRSGGVYHRVNKGETLWSISKRYGVKIDQIAEANRLPDKRKIFVRQQLFIPTATKELAISLSGDKAFSWPIKGNVLSFYGSIQDNVRNKGIDIRARQGQRVFSSRNGTVSYADENMKGFGKTLIIDHGDGFSTVYAHNSKILVAVGDQVTKKTVIARAGSTGRASSPRLHFEIRKNKAPCNPFYYLP